MSKEYDERSDFTDEKRRMELAPNYLTASNILKARAPHREHELSVKR